MSKKGEKEVMHIRVCTMRIYFSKGKVTPPSLKSSSLISHESVNPGVSAWLDLRGRVDATFMNTGSEARRHRLMDDSALFCVACTHAGAVTDIRCPRACISVAGSLSIQLSISGQRAWLYATAGVTPVYSHNACLLFGADTLHNDSVCSTDASQREQRVSDSNSRIYGRW